jgi:hypothetical protein
MSLIVETIKRTIADQKRSCGFNPHIQLLINSKVGTSTYLLDRKHLPMLPEFKDNVVVMDPSHPTSVEAQAKMEAAVAAKAAKEASAPSSSIAQLKTKYDQMNYLLEATQRIEQSLANLVKNQASLERIVETKFYDLDVKVTKIQTIVEKLQRDVDRVRESDEDSGDERPTTDRFHTVPRASRSAAVPTADVRTTVSAPAAAPSVPPPVSTKPAQQTSAEAFAYALLSMPSTLTRAANQRSSPPGAAGDHA